MTRIDDLEKLDQIERLLNEALTENTKRIASVELYISSSSSSKRRRGTASLLQPFADIPGVEQLWQRNVHSVQRSKFFAENLSSLDVNKFNWSKLEDQMLLKVVSRENVSQSHCMDWGSVASVLKARSPSSCQIRYEHHLANTVNHSIWTKEEDLLLVQLADSSGCVGWREIANQLGTGRTPVQCFQRYQKSLNTQLITSKFSEREDAKLIELMTKRSEVNWGIIAAELGGTHTGAQVARRWRSALKTQDVIRKGRWTLDEESVLRRAVEIYGDKRWADVASHMPTKNEFKCRDRWEDALRPGIKFWVPWTAEEDSTLLAAVEKYGPGNWVNIVKDLPGRTDHMCCQRFKSLNVKGTASAYMDKVHIKRTVLTRSHTAGRQRPNLTVEDFLMIKQQDLAVNASENQSLDPPLTLHLDNSSANSNSVTFTYPESLHY